MQRRQLHLWDDATCSQSLREVDGARCPVSPLPLLDRVESGAIRAAGCLIAQRPPSALRYGED